MLQIGSGIDMIQSHAKSHEVIVFLIDYLITSLDELTAMPKKSSFIKGEITSFVECLEVLSLWEGFRNYGIEDIEKIYPIKY